MFLCINTELSRVIDEALQVQLLTSASSIRSRALAELISLLHAGDWLNGVSYPTLGLHLQDQEFRYCLRYWLEVSLHSAPYPCPECHGTAGQFDYQVGCSGNVDRILHHNAIHDALLLLPSQQQSPLLMRLSGH